MRRALACLVVLGLVCASAPAALSAPGRGEPVQIGEGRVIYNQKAFADSTVVAVIDSNFVPYHWDFLASRMPQRIARTIFRSMPHRTRG